MNLKKVRMIVLIVIATALVTGCGQPAPTFEPVTITFSCPNVDEAYYESLIPVFNEQFPDITVELNPYTDTPASSSDVVVLQWFQTLNDEPGPLAVQTLDLFLEQEQDFSADAFYPDALSAFEWDDKIYGIPLSVEPWVMFYNKELFNAAGVELPQEDWDLTTFRSTAQSLRNQENRTYGYANGNFGYIDSLMFLYAYGGALSDPNGVPTINSPINNEAVKWYVDLYEDNRIAPKRAQAETDFGYGQNPSMLGVADGKIAMFVGQFSSRGGMNFDDPWEFEWGMAPIPSGQTSFALAFFEGAAIPIKSLHPNEAWKWISFLSRQVPNRAIPARLELTQSEAFAQQAGEEFAEVGRHAMNGALLLTRDNLQNFGIGIDIFISMIDSIVNSNLDINRELDKAQMNAELRRP